MAIDPANIRKRDYAVGEIAASNLSAALKEDLTAVVENTAETTNGLTARDKLQKMSENLFDLSRLLALFIVAQGRRVATWKDVAIAFKWPIVIMFGFLCLALMLRPELAALVESISHNIHP